MRTGETSLGGPENRFPSTGSELLAGWSDPASFDFLCRHYWKPVYAYVRSAWKKNNEEAKDLTQAFFLWLHEGGALGRFDPGRGSFRGYLKTLLQRFVGHEEVALSRLKRGGGRKILSLDAALPPTPAAADPDAAFDQVWLSGLLARAVERARAQCLSEGKDLLFRVYEACSLGAETERPSHGEIAERFGIQEKDVKRHLFNARERIRACLREELAAITANDRELQDEWNWILGS